MCLFPKVSTVNDMHLPGLYVAINTVNPCEHRMTVFEFISAFLMWDFFLFYSSLIREIEVFLITTVRQTFRINHVFKIHNFVTTMGSNHKYSFNLELKETVLFHKHTCIRTWI